MIRVFTYGPGDQGFKIQKREPSGHHWLKLANLLTYTYIYSFLGDYVEINAVAIDTLLRQKLKNNTRLDPPDINGLLSSSVGSGI